MRSRFAPSVGRRSSWPRPRSVGSPLGVDFDAFEDVFARDTWSSETAASSATTGRTTSRRSSRLPGSGRRAAAFAEQPAVSRNSSVAVAVYSFSWVSDSRARSAARRSTLAGMTLRRLTMRSPARSPLRVCHAAVIGRRFSHGFRHDDGAVTGRGGGGRRRPARERGWIASAGPELDPPGVLTVTDPDPRPLEGPGAPALRDAIAKVTGLPAARTARRS